MRMRHRSPQNTHEGIISGALRFITVYQQLKMIKSPMRADHFPATFIFQAHIKNNISFIGRKPRRDPQNGEKWENIEKLPTVVH